MPTFYRLKTNLYQKRFDPHTMMTPTARCETPLTDCARQFPLKFARRALYYRTNLQPLCYWEINNNNNNLAGNIVPVSQ